MTKMIFVNLPVADLPKSMAFYEALGFVNEPRFTDETAAAMQWSETIVVMLLTHDKWKSFTTKAIPNAKESAQVSLAINLDDRAAVDAITETAGASGGAADPSPPQDYGFMYQRSFEDPDGHGWEPLWMDPKVATGEAPVEPIEA
jgi:predicted lactoylglutathione lyase